MIDSFTFEHAGRQYKAEIHADESMGPPWEEHDGHGIVSDWTTRDKAPGELVLATDGRSRRFYDFSGSCARARAEGWDSAPYNTGQESKAAQAAKAARADYEYLRAWCADEWSWCGVVVVPLCDCCGAADESRSESLWGIDSSDGGAYLQEVARELAEQVQDAAQAA